jgi:fido (protein-threonine AMPylation protein)
MNTKFDDQSVDSIHKKLYGIMWNYVGMARNKEGLEKGSEDAQGHSRRSSTSTCASLALSEGSERGA